MTTKETAVDKRVMRERILEILEDVSEPGWDQEVRDELAESIATAMTKLEMESIFDEEVDEEDDAGDMVF